LRAQFDTQVDPADALGAEVGVKDNSVAHAEEKPPTYGNQDFAPLKALALMLASHVLLQENLPYNLVGSPNILTTDTKKVVIYIVLREAILTDVNAAAIGFLGLYLR